MIPEGFEHSAEATAHAVKKARCEKCKEGHYLMRRWAQQQAGSKRKGKVDPDARLPSD